MLGTFDLLKRFLRLILQELRKTLSLVFYIAMQVVQIVWIIFVLFLTFEFDGAFLSAADFTNITKGDFWRFLLICLMLCIIISILYHYHYI